MSGNEEEMRIAAYRLVARAETDPDFAKRVQEEPAVMLREAGLPEDALDGSFREEASGYDCCRDFTCWTSGCPCSCFVSFPGHVLPTVDEPS